MTPYWKAINARKTMKPLLVITVVRTDDLYYLQPDVNHLNQATSTSKWSEAFGPARTESPR